MTIRVIQWLALAPRRGVRTLSRRRSCASRAPWASRERRPWHALTWWGSQATSHTFKRAPGVPSIDRLLERHMLTQHPSPIRGHGGHRFRRRLAKPREREKARSRMCPGDKDAAPVKSPVVAVGVAVRLPALALSATCAQADASSSARLPRSPRRGRTHVHHVDTTPDPPRRGPHAATTPDPLPRPPPRSPPHPRPTRALAPPTRQEQSMAQTHVWPPCRRLVDNFPP